MNQEFYTFDELLNTIMKEVTKRQMENGEMIISGEDVVNLLGHYTCPMCGNKFLTEQQAKDHRAYTNVDEYKTQFMNEQIGSIEAN